jgi:DNA polymerase-4
MRLLLHLDLDAFFVSVERILNPQLEGKPVIVGANPKGRGVVSACSYEARKFGLRSGMPIRQAYSLCPNGIYIRGHHDEYVRYSRMVKKIIAKHVPIVEQASIDEFYIDFVESKNSYSSAITFATELQKEILNELSLPCSVGIGKNKTIAKIASDFMKPLGITFVPPGKEKDFLAPMPIGAVPGIGKVLTKKLTERGFYHVADIAKFPSEYFSASFGKFGTIIWEKAHGHGGDILHTEHEQKSFSRETTFKEDVLGLPILEKTLFKLTGEVAQDIRDDNLKAATISIKLRYSDFVTLTRSKTIQYTDDDKVIYETALKLLRTAYTRRIAVRLIGVGVSKVNTFTQQHSLFDTYDAKRRNMFSAINLLRKKFGFEIVEIGRAE